MMTLTLGQPAALPQPWQARARRCAPLLAIVMVHVFGLVMFQSGMLHQVSHAILPQVVNVSFIASPEPLKPPPAPPKTVMPAQLAPVVIAPLPLVNLVQTEPTITAAPAPNHPSPVAAVAVTSAAPAPVSAHSSAPAQPKTVTGVEYIRAPQPVYPSISRRLGETGIVVLRVLIGEKGQAEQVQIHQSSGSNNLDEAGRQAVLRALYKPNLEDGKPVAVYALVPVNFQLG